MRILPLSLTELIFRLPRLRRPEYLADLVSERPCLEELRAGIVLVEIRGGHLKWAHLRCPQCGDHIELPLAGNVPWTVRMDFFRRPTLAPSVWERAGCGAHFFLQKGKVEWCGWGSP